MKYLKFKGKIKNPKVRVGLKFLLSVFILYHLAMIFIIPNRFSMLHEKLMPYFVPYAQSFSLFSSWDFFAPNPTKYFFYEYEVVSTKDQVDTFRWPPSREESQKIFFNHNRLINHSRFFILLGQQGIKKYFLPYLCLIHPLAKEISVKVIIENRPHFKKAKTFKRGFFSKDNKDNMSTWMQASAGCKNKSKFRDIDSEDPENFEEFSYNSVGAQ